MQMARLQIIDGASDGDIAAWIQDRLTKALSATEGGIARMHQFISDTAKYGDLTRGPRIIDEHVKQKMREVLKEVQDGTFAKQWIEENRTGQKNYKRLMQEDLDQGIEKVGKELRGRMSWLQE